MKLKTFTFLKHKTYLFSFIVLMLGSILSALPAFSQVDYYYGLNKKGIRFGVGAGVSILKSNWSANSPGGTGLVSLDYDLNPYFSIGLQGQFGTLSGKDADGKFYYYSTAVVFYGGNLNFKVALGQFYDFKTSCSLQDIVKRIYLGAGVGEVYAESTLKNHTDGQGLSDITNGLILPNAKPTSTGIKGSGTFTAVPVNFGTNIAIRGFLGSDRVELNPNLQYTFVLSPLFDGYQPNSIDNPASYINKNGDQAYFVGSLTLRFKF